MTAAVVHSGNARAGRVRPALRLLAQMLAAAVLFGTLAGLAVQFTQGKNGIAAVWLPNAIALVLLVRCRFAHPRAILAATTLGNVAASLIAGRSLTFAIGLAGCNTAEIALALFLIGRWCGVQPEMHVLRTQMKFIAACAVAAPIASATLALTILQPATFGVAASTWFSWALTDGLGMLMIAPAGMIISEPGRRFLKGITPLGALEWTALTGLLIAGTLGVFIQTQFPFLFMILPFVLLHAFRLNTLGTAFAVIQVAVIAIVCTWLGYGPINLIEQSLTTKLVVLQCFLATSFAMGLPVAAALAGHERLLARVRESEERLALLAENVSDAVMRISFEGICEFASPSAAPLFGAHIDDIVGANVVSLISAEDLPGMREMVLQLQSGSIDSGLYTFRSRLHAERGKTVWIEVNNSLVHDADGAGPGGGAPNAFVASARDVTARVELEAELVRARQHAENAAAAKSHFLANMSHEIRTPMNGVLGFADLLLHEALPEKALRHVRMIGVSGRAMMRLLNDILDISKIEAGQIVVTTERLRLPDLVDECVTLMSANAEQKGLVLAARIDPGVPEEIVCDSLRLRQILLNLIGNAVKFTAAGGVRVDIEMRGDAASRMLTIAVCDTGIGIAAPHIEAIFRPFEQADGSVARRFGGTGLGLSISRQLAELLGGTLTAHSREGAGSQFVLTLPLVEGASALAELDEPKALASPPPKLVPELAPAATGCHILLVEDHDINRYLAREMLERLGQRVTIAVDGGEAIAAVRHAQPGDDPFDLVLMDVQMPVCDGYAATRAIRAGGYGAAALPIVALTANAYREDIAEALAAGMQGHLAKPLDFAALSAVLAKWLPAAGSGAAAVPEWTPPAGDDPITARWLARRAEALEEVAAFVRSGAASDTALGDLAATMHKLAGSAGMFGEDALGEHARGLEDAIRDGKPVPAVTDLAETMLRAA